MQFTLYKCTTCRDNVACRSTQIVCGKIGLVCFVIHVVLRHEVATGEGYNFIWLETLVYTHHRVLWLIEMTLHCRRVLQKYIFADFDLFWTELKLLSTSKFHKLVNWVENVECVLRHYKLNDIGNDYKLRSIQRKIIQ